VRPAGSPTPARFPCVTHRLTLAGTTAELRADRSLFLPDFGTLIVADVHWGKAATFRALGVPVPHGTTRAGLDRLDAALTETAATQLLVLGDLFHARAGMQPGTLDAIGAWRNARRELAITLVRGNHDLHAGDPPASLTISCVNAPFTFGPFALHHHPAAGSADGYALAGHVHPVVHLRGRGRQKLTLPCFAFGAAGGLLPAFGEFTGGGVIDPDAYPRTFVIADDAVLPVDASAADQPPYVTPG
jgi:uncharacterized protein